MMYDVIIIGGGVVGCGVARELSRYKAKILLLEKTNDICNGQSKANTAIIHGGYDAKPNTLKAKFNVLGNTLLWKDAEDLGVKHLKCGSIVVAKEGQEDKIARLQEKAKANGVEVEVWDRQQTVAFEPNVADDIVMSLYAPSAGVVSPYQLAIAYADRAILNGAKIALETEVKGIAKSGEVFKINTSPLVTIICLISEIII